MSSESSNIDHDIRTGRVVRTRPTDLDPCSRSGTGSLLGRDRPIAINQQVGGDDRVPGARLPHDPVVQRLWDHLVSILEREAGSSPDSVSGAIQGGEGDDEEEDNGEDEDGDNGDEEEDRDVGTGTENARLVLNAYVERVLDALGPEPGRATPQGDEVNPTMSPLALRAAVLESSRINAQLRLCQLHLMRKLTLALGCIGPAPRYADITVDEYNLIFNNALKFAVGSLVGVINPDNDEMAEGSA